MVHIVHNPPLDLILFLVQLLQLAVVLVVLTVRFQVEFPVMVDLEDLVVAVLVTVVVVVVEQDL
jgi:hypothetical protein